MLDLFRGAGSR